MTKRCAKCYFALVYKESLGKYKCSKCRTTYTTKEVDNLEFRKEDSLQQEREIVELEDQVEQRRKEIRDIITELKEEDRELEDKSNGEFTTMVIKKCDRNLIKICATMEGKSMRRFVAAAVRNYIDKKGLDKVLTKESNNTESE